MYTSYSIKDIRANLLKFRSIGKSVALVPTMGALHDGHLHLIREAKREYDVVVCSIFVNPLQFNSLDDFDKYPRHKENDIKLLEISGCDLAFVPDVGEMYNSQSVLKIDLGKLDSVLEGEYRPGHFSGVALVVSKLLNIVWPDAAYFGQKDLQQLAVIRLLVKELSFQVSIKEVPTVRNEKGLALSSRNQRLSSNGIQIASHLHQVLKFCLSQLTAEKTMSWQDIQKNALLELQSQGIAVEYLELVDKYSFEVYQDFPERQTEKTQNLHLCVAGWIEQIRLIDNVGLIP